MARGLLLVAPTLACLATAGCSLIYNADDLRHDAAPVDAVPVDVDPSHLAIDTVVPTDVQEGQGDDGGRPVVFELDGDSIDSHATVTAVLDPDGTPMSITPDEVGIGAGGNLVVVALRIPVLGDLADGATRVLRFTVTQDGATPATKDVTVDGLDELAPAASPLVLSSLHAAYSRATFATPSALTFTGTVPAVIVVTGGITVTADMHADAAGVAGGPGGCDGGAGGPASNGGSPGGCGAMGGRGGGPSSLLGAGGGGGGGAFGTDGDMGAGTGGGSGGGNAGNDMLVPIITVGNTAGNRGGGGGGAGAGTLGAGGAAGGGGGVIELAAGGDVMITGAITANGAAGVGNNGSGGGGSGGGILVRSGGAISGAGSLAALGHAGGTGTNAGGEGGVGRVRVDAVSGSLSANPPAVRGPTFDAATPVLATTRDLDVTVHGEPGHTFGVELEDAPVADVLMTASGNGMTTVHLRTGRNRLCVAYGPNDSPDLDKPEARSCLDVGFAQ